MRVQVFGASGMLGSEIVRYLSRDPTIEVQGVARVSMTGACVDGLDISDAVQVLNLVEAFRPNVIVNCIGRRQTPRSAADMAALIDVNSRWPHKLAAIAAERAARLIHFSSDAVFSGATGNYAETDKPDAADAYGLSKLLGEPLHPNCMTIRTSMIGHENPPGDQLVDWFLRQTAQVNGHARAVFSGLPTNEIARVLHTVLLARCDMPGIWHLAAEPITKFALLAEIASRYGVSVELAAANEPVIDRSLDGTKFSAETGYKAPPWPQLIGEMHAARLAFLGETDGR